ncbi:MAG: D-alanine--D-alanine ligase A, partial [Clostridiales bacterium]|nr:D-alanine--D-alanine ligase A [Clostridiales bacterium]
MGRKRIAVLFGGQSSEHMVSCMSAANVIEQLDGEKYDPLLIGITEEGHWLRAERVDEIRSGAWREGKVEAILSPDATKKCVVLTEQGRVRTEPVDVVFPVLHGLCGEDGTVQGLLE